MRKIINISFFILLYLCLTSMINHERDSGLWDWTDEFSRHIKHHGAKANDIDVLRVVKYGNPNELCDEHDEELWGCCGMWLNILGWVYHAEVVVKKLGSEAKEKAVLFHELGHCLLNLDHVDDDKDLMYYFLTEWVEWNLDEATEKLFKRIKKED